MLGADYGMPDYHGVCDQQRGPWRQRFSDPNANYNFIRNAATVFNCMGVRPADNSGTNGGAESTQIQRVWLQNTWGYNLGYFNNAYKAVTASLSVSEVITHRSGCADFYGRSQYVRPFKPADKLQRGNVRS